MEKIKLTEQQLKNVIESVIKNVLTEGVYDNDWISSLKKYFDADVEIEKQETIKPFYGGGWYEQIAFNIIFKQPISNIGRAVLHGIMANGRFMDASIILFDVNDYGIFHGMIGLIDYNSSNGKISDVCEKIEQKINKISTKNK